MDKSFSRLLVTVVITRSAMKSIFIFVIVFLLFELVNNVAGQGSPIASIGTYIIKYKERKRQQALKAARKKNKARQPPRQKTSHNSDDSFPFYDPYRSYYT